MCLLSVVLNIKIALHVYFEAFQGRFFTVNKFRKLLGPENAATQVQLWGGGGALSLF